MHGIDNNCRCRGTARFGGATYGAQAAARDPAAEDLCGEGTNSVVVIMMLHGECY